jgi:HSP20 family protein
MSESEVVGEVGRRFVMFTLMPRKLANENREVFGFVPRPLARLRDEFEPIFNRLFSPWPVPFERWTYPETYLGFEMEETDKEYLICVEAPGFEIKDFSINVAGNFLTLWAEHMDSVKGPKAKVEGHHSNRRLERTLTLPAGVVAEKIEAFYRNGILELHLPKTEEAKPVKIAVRA